MHRHNKLFTWFLVLYTLVLIYHATSLDWHSGMTVAAVALGLVVAVIAHLGRGAGTTILLVVHMAIEWSEYAAHGSSFTHGEIAFYAVHTLLDFAFLWEETRIHLPRLHRAIFWTTTTGLLALFAIVHWSAAAGSMLIESAGGGFIEPLVIGGILGCTLSHLLGKRSTHLHS